MLLEKYQIEIKTRVQINGTHVTYNNKLAAGSPDEELRKGQVVIGSKNSQVRSYLFCDLFDN